MKENEKRNIIEVVQKDTTHAKRDYTILVPIQRYEQFNRLLPTAIEIAKNKKGKVIILNIIEIPYQLPPSAAKKLTLEQELFLMPGMEMLNSAECRGSTAIRIAHNAEKAIKRFGRHESVNIIVRDSSLVSNNNNIFDRLRESLKLSL